MKEVKVTRWSGDDPPTETQLREMMAREGLSPYAWSNGPGDVYSAHQHSYEKVITVARGSITFQLPERGESLTLSTGDRLDLPAHVRHAATVGAAGVTCLEAHR